VLFLLCYRPYAGVGTSGEVHSVRKRYLLVRKNMTEGDTFSFGFYFQTLTGLLSSPRHFFANLPVKVGYARSLGFLLVSSLFFTGASLTHIQGQRFLMASILFVNAVAMPLIAAGVGFMITTMTFSKRSGFERFFAVYAFSAGVTLLVAWIPLFLWISEPWKWLLTGIGLVKGCGLRWFQALVVIGFSILVLILFFWSLGPVIHQIRQTPPP
jgi:hypothetical protein